MKLPQDFVDAMKALLQEEAQAFFDSYDQPRSSGLRANGLKLSPQRLREMTDMARARIPWTESGFYTDGEDRPGKHPFYHLGLYYVQEPSAMLPAELLGVRPGDKVLDLCAAPGGKTVQLADKLQGSGILVTNDNAAERTKALAKNVELSGIRNAVVLNEEPIRIAERFGAWFDRVLVDAPCSGEGMFRKDEDMVRQWERHSVERCCRMQRDILRYAAELVVPGGRMVYSTCTFNARENEGTVARFLADRPDFRVVAVDAAYLDYGFGRGRPDWLLEEEASGLDEERRASIEGAVRIWPHKTRGEGHFAVLLERSGEGFAEFVWQAEALEVGGSVGRQAAVAKLVRGGRGKEEGHGGEADVLGKFDAFLRDTMPDWVPPGNLYVRGSTLYSPPKDLPVLDGLNAVRPGWLLGTATKHRFEPSQALAMGLSGSEPVRVLKLSSSQPECLRYLKGETLQPESGLLAGRGWTLVLVDGFPAGWGRWDGSTLKNERLAGWRWI